MRVLTRCTTIRLRSETHQGLVQIGARERIPPAQLMRSAIERFLEGYMDAANGGASSHSSFASTARVSRVCRFDDMMPSNTPKTASQGEDDEEEWCLVYEADSPSGSCSEQPVGEAKRPAGARKEERC